MPRGEGVLVKSAGISCEEVKSAVVYLGRVRAEGAEVCLGRGEKAKAAEMAS